jgi:RNA polymerase sigma factor (TIGR02999 family)
VNDVTRLLLACRDGDSGAFEQLMSHVYEELRRRAHRYMRSERPNHTLQTTALVHETYLKMIDMEIPWKDREHFFAVAATAMRRILVDHARAHRAERRGGGQARFTFDEALRISSEPPEDLMALDEALERFTRLDERKARVVELHFFAGLSFEEIARMLEVSVSTIQREMRLARAWLHREMGYDSDGP